MTLQDLSDAAGVSVSYISQIERDQVTPTLGTLASIAQSLGVRLDYFVAMPKVSDSLVRREDRRRFSLDGVSQEYEQIGTELPNHEMSAFMIYVPDGYCSETVSHDGEEFIHVLDGEIEMTLDDESFALRHGDSLHYRGNRKHSWRNAAGKTAQLLWVGQLAHFPMRGIKPLDLSRDAIVPGRSAAESTSSNPNRNSSKGAQK